MNIIRVENIIATYFNQNPDKDIITYDTINKLKDILTKEFAMRNMTIYVDTTRGTLLSALLVSPDLFEKKEKECESIIKLKDRQKFDEEFKRYFNAKIDREIKPIYRQLVEVFKEPI